MTGSRVTPENNTSSARKLPPVGKRRKGSGNRPHAFGAQAVKNMSNPIAVCKE
jgi:hypothetical protein